MTLHWGIYILSCHICFLSDCIVALITLKVDQLVFVRVSVENLFCKFTVDFPQHNIIIITYITKHNLTFFQFILLEI